MNVIFWQESHDYDEREGFLVGNGLLTQHRAKEVLGEGLIHHGAIIRRFGRDGS